jgi:diguanylate cyclase (GGDEF)-like protein/PAS domain S-box-containing protein
MDRSPEDFAVRAQQAAIFALLKGGIPTAGTPTAWRALTEAAARTLAVARASVWILSDARDRLTAVDLYERDQDTHSHGTALEAHHYPTYFRALCSDRAVVAPDAIADPRTCEYAVDYLGANGIVSMLDAGIWQDGEARGVVCIETVGERRDWTVDEQQFTSSIADIAATVLVHESLRNARSRLQESQDLFSSALRASPDAVAIVRLSDGRLMLVNESLVRMSGYREQEMIGRTTLELGFWVDLTQRDVWLARIKREGSVRDFEVEFRARDGRTGKYLLFGERVEIGGSTCLVLVIRDVTNRKRQEQLVFQVAQGVAAATGESFFRPLVGHLAAALDADIAFVGEIDAADAGRIRTIAVQSGGRPAADFTYQLSGSPCETILGRGICSYPDCVAEKFPADRALARDGIAAYVGAPLTDSGGKPLGLIAVLFRRPLEDTQLAESLLRIFAMRASGELERRNDVRSLEHLAHHDPLTGLPNRILFKQRLDAGLAKEGAGHAALFLIDLDRFKEINDTLGHPVGDILLQRVANLLATGVAARWQGEVARLGGDEFAILMPGISAPREAQAIAAGIRAMLTAPIDIEGYRLEVGASIGVALAPSHATTSSGLLRCADVAMYAAKRQGKGHHIYDATQDPYSTERLALLSDMGEAIRAGEMRVHYQPRISLADGRVRGFEALVRWEHPRLGLLAPSRFVPLAELSDVIRPLTFWVLRAALRQQREWRDAGRDTRIAVNLSARHLMDESCATQIERLLITHGVAPSALELEITESAIIHDPERARVTLERIRALGVHLAIDDFGTGFSSLVHLRRLPINALKIDVSFVKAMLASPADRAIVESTIHLAHDLGLTVVAEGVENEATREALRAQGCDEGQGFAIGRPMPEVEATAWLAAHA